MKSSFKTLGLVAPLLLAACISTPQAALLAFTLEPSPTITSTPIWFPATATPTPFPTPVISPTADLRVGIGELLLEDNFDDATAWATSSDNDATAAVSNGRLNLVLKDRDSYLVTTRSTPTFTDFYAEITATTNFCNGEDEYGLVVRALDGDHYRLALSCDGRAKVDRLRNGLSRQAGWFSSGAIPSVTPGSSRLGVYAAGSQLHFYVNGLYLFSVTDTLLFKGTIGAFVHTAGEGDVSVSFSNLQVWAVER